MAELPALISLATLRLAASQDRYQVAYDGEDWRPAVVREGVVSFEDQPAETSPLWAWATKVPVENAGFHRDNGWDQLEELADLNNITLIQIERLKREGALTAELLAKLMKLGASIMVLDEAIRDVRTLLPAGHLEDEYEVGRVR